jgi:tetratricopeptide (TPR) repeat protein
VTRNWLSSGRGGFKQPLLWLCLLSLCSQQVGWLLPNSASQAMASTPIASTPHGQATLETLQFVGHRLHLLGKGLSLRPQWHQTAINSMAEEANELDDRDQSDQANRANQADRQRLTLDLPGVAMSAILPTDAQLTQQLRQQWPGFYSLQVVALANGVDQGLRLIIDVANTSAVPQVIVCGGNTSVIATHRPQPQHAILATKPMPPVLPLLADTGAVTLLAIQSLPVLDLMPLRLTKHVLSKPTSPQPALAKGSAHHQTTVSRKAPSQRPKALAKAHNTVLPVLALKAGKPKKMAQQAVAIDQTAFLKAQHTIAQQQHRLSQLAHTISLLNQQLQQAKAWSQQASSTIGLRVTPVKVVTKVVDNPQLVSTVTRQTNTITALGKQLTATSQQLAVAKKALAQQAIASVSPVGSKPLPSPTTANATSLNATKQQLQQAMGVITQQRAQLTAVKQQIKLVLDEVNTTHREQMTHLVDKLEVAEATLKTYRSAQNQLNPPAIATALVTERDELKAQLAQSTLDNQHVNQQWATLKQQYDQLQSQLIALKQQPVQQATISPAPQSNPLPAPVPEATALRSRLVAIETSHAKLEQALGQAQQVTASLQAQLSPLQAQNKALLSDNLGLHNALNQAKAMTTSLNAVAVATPAIDKLTPEIPQVNTLLSQANTLTQRHEMAKAITLLQQGLNDHPKDRQLQAALGKLYLQQGQLTQADQLLTQSLDPEGLSNYAITLKKLGQLDKAETLLKLALTLTPADATLHYNLGNVYLAQQQLPNAQSQLEQALVLQPAFAEACYQLGLVLAKQNKPQQASEQWQRFIQLAPKSPKVAMIRPILKQFASMQPLAKP